MTRSRLLVGVASVLAGTAVLMAVLGVVYNPVLLPAALPFGAAAYFLWSHVTGRLEPRVRRGSTSGAVGRGGGRAGPGRGRETEPGDPSRSPRVEPADRDAARVLGVEPDADEAALRRAFRERAKALHPDAGGGDEAAFRRARAAYERLRDGR